MKASTQPSGGQVTKNKGEVTFNKSEKTKDVRSDNINAAKGIKVFLSRPNFK